MQVTQHKPSNAKKQKENKYLSQAEPVRAKKGKNTLDIKFVTRRIHLHIQMYLRKTLT